MKCDSPEDPTGTLLRVPREPPSPVLRTTQKSAAGIPESSLSVLVRILQGHSRNTSGDFLKHTASNSKHTAGSLKTLCNHP